MLVSNKIKVVVKSFMTTLLLLYSIGAYAIIERPNPPRLVNDYASILTIDQLHTLENRLVAYSDSTTTQIVVVIVPDLEGMDAGSYATQIGLEWGVGSEKFDNGAVILVKPKNDNGGGEVFIAIGYGLEGAIPDARAKSIINNIMIPNFIEDDYYAAIEGACDAIIRMADGEEFVSGVDSEGDGGGVIVGVVLFFVVLLMLARFSKKKGGGSSSGGVGSGTSYIPPYTPSRRGSGRGSSGGFGGFGGGSFGGAGAGGKW